ncbi:PREDICTED: B3 [Prunus dulcis]|nr:PREDICTED: B3 [Prunus dulcis]
MAAHDMPDQPQDCEDPGYEDKEMTDSIKGAHDLLYLKHTILDYKTARKLEHMKSKILSGIELNSPSGSKQKALRIQESEATNGAAQGRRELQFQQEGGGGLFYGHYAPPDLPPITSLRKLIQDCCKPFEKQLTPSDVSKTPRLCLNKEYVENHIKLVLRDGENPNEGIDLTTYDMEGKEYPMKFTTWGTDLYVLSKGWKTFCHDVGLVETQDFLTLYVFRHAKNGGLCFAIHSRRLPVFETIKKRRQRKQN